MLLPIVTGGAAEGLTLAEGLILADGLTDGEMLGLTEGEIDGDTEGLTEGDTDGLIEADGETDGLILGEILALARVVKIIHDNAPFSVCVTPVQVIVTVPAVVVVAVVKRKAPASSSISSVAFAQVLAFVSF